jgi:hypothetical protein
VSSDARPAGARREIAKEIANRPIGGLLVVVGHEAMAGWLMVIRHGFQRIDPPPPRPKTSSQPGHTARIAPWLSKPKKATTGIEPVCKALQASA